MFVPSFVVHCFVPFLVFAIILVSWISLQCVIMVFPDLTHLLFGMELFIINKLNLQRLAKKSHNKIVLVA